MARKKLQVWLPLIFSVVMIIGMMIGYQLRAKTTGGNSFLQNTVSSPLQEVMGLIKNKYVDNVNMDSLEEPAITGVLERLDPHSVFIPAQEVENVVINAEFIKLRDDFGHQRLREGKYTPGQIDAQWSDEIKKDFLQWIKDNPSKVPMTKEELDNFLKDRTW